MSSIGTLALAAVTLAASFSLAVLVEWAMLSAIVRAVAPRPQAGAKVPANAKRRFLSA